MARVTVEDCIDKVENRFELVMVASQRARRLSNGAALTVERDNDKNPVVALREIAAETVSVPETKEELVRARQKVVHTAEDDEELVDLLEGDIEMPGADSDETMEQAVEQEKMDSALADIAGA